MGPVLGLVKGPERWQSTGLAHWEGAMLDVFFNGVAIWFGVPALSGTALFTVKLALLAMGADHSVEAHDLPHDPGGDPHSDSAGAFKLLSIQGIVAFIMGFGWGGLAAPRVVAGMVTLEGIESCPAGGGALVTPAPDNAMGKLLPPPVNVYVTLSVATAVGE